MIRQQGQETILHLGFRSEGADADVKEALFNRDSGLAEVVIPPRSALVGQAMKATKGKANPAQVNEILRRRLAG